MNSESSYYWDPYTQTWYVKAETVPPSVSEPSSEPYYQSPTTQKPPLETSTPLLDSTTEPDFDYDPLLSQLPVPTSFEPALELRPYVRKRKTVTRTISTEVPISETILSGKPFPLYGKDQGTVVKGDLSRKEHSTEPFSNLKKVKTKLSNLKSTYSSTLTHEPQKSTSSSITQRKLKVKEPKLMFHRVASGISSERAQKSIEEHKRHLKGTAAYLSRKAIEEKEQELRRKK